jgi:hypothetical protein
MSALLTLLAAGSAVALVTHSRHEEFGPSTESPQSLPDTPEFSFRFAPERRYWLEEQWDGWGVSSQTVTAAFGGDLTSASRALGTFSKMPDEEKEIRLFPAPGMIRSVDGKKTAACDWKVHWFRQSGVTRSDGKTFSTRRAVMTIYIARADAIPAEDPRIPGWIDQLGATDFAVRDKASRALSDLGEAAVPALRRALGSEPTFEQKRRIDALLARLSSIHVARLTLPKNVTFVSIDEAVAREEKKWHSGDLASSWHAAESLSAWAEHSEATLPLLAEALHDSRVQVRDLAVDAFRRLGPRAASVAATLKRAEAGATAEARTAIAAALREVTREGAAPADWSENRRLRQGITDFCVARRRS